MRGFPEDKYWSLIPSLKLTWPLKIGLPNRKGLYSNHPFLGAMLVSGRVTISYITTKNRGGYHGLTIAVSIFTQTWWGLVTSMISGGDLAELNPVNKPQKNERMALKSNQNTATKVSGISSKTSNFSAMSPNLWEPCSKIVGGRSEEPPKKKMLIVFGAQGGSFYYQPTQSIISWKPWNLP